MPGVSNLALFLSISDIHKMTPASKGLLYSLEVETFQVLVLRLDNYAIPHIIPRWPNDEQAPSFKTRNYSFLFVLI